MTGVACPEPDCGLIIGNFHSNGITVRMVLFGKTAAKKPATAKPAAGPRPAKGPAPGMTVRGRG